MHHRVKKAMALCYLLVVPLVTLAAGKNIENLVNPIDSLQYSTRYEAKTQGNIDTISTPLLTGHPLTASHTTHYLKAQGRNHPINTSIPSIRETLNPQGKTHPDINTSIPSVRETLNPQGKTHPDINTSIPSVRGILNHHRHVETVNIRTGIADTALSLADIETLKDSTYVPEPSERILQSISSGYPNSHVSAYGNSVQGGTDDETRVYDTHNTRIRDSEVLASIHVGTRLSNVSLEEAESRIGRLTKVLPNPNIKVIRRGRTVGRFTGLSRPLRLLPPAQTKESVTDLPLYNYPGSYNPRTQNIRARKAKIRFTPGRRNPSATYKENKALQEVIETVSVTEFPPLTLPPPKQVQDMMEFEFGRKKNIEVVEKLSPYVGNQENNTYPQHLENFLEPPLEFRKYTISDISRPVSVTVRHKGKAVHDPQHSPQTEGVSVHPPRARTSHQGKSRRVKARDGYRRRHTGLSSLPVRMMDPRGTREEQDEGPRGTLSKHDVGPRGTLSKQDVGPRGTLLKHDVDPRGTLSKQDVGPRGTLFEHNVDQRGTLLKHDVDPRGTREKLDVGPRGTLSKHDVGPRGTLLKHDVDPRGTREKLDVGPRGNLSKHDVGPRGTLLKQDVGPRGTLSKHDIGAGAVIPSPIRHPQLRPRRYFLKSEGKSRPSWRQDQSYDIQVTEEKNETQITHVHTPPTFQSNRLSKPFRPPWGQDHSYNTQVSTQTDEEKESPFTSIRKPPPYHSTENRVNKPFITSTTSSYEDYTPFTVRPPRQRQSSPRRARRPRPSPLHDTHTQQVIPEITNDLSRQSAAVTFTCAGRTPGHYADQGAACKVFHVCQQDGRQDMFVCPQGTLFNQHLLTCDHKYRVACQS